MRCHLLYGVGILYSLSDRAYIKLSRRSNRSVNIFIFTMQKKRIKISELNPRSLCAFLLFKLGLCYTPFLCFYEEKRLIKLRFCKIFIAFQSNSCNRLWKQSYSSPLPSALPRDRYRYTYSVCSFNRPSVSRVVYVHLRCFLMNSRWRCQYLPIS